MNVRIAERTNGLPMSLHFLGNNFRPSIRSGLAANNWRAFFREPNSRWLCVLFAVGGFLRIYGLDFQSLWHDEGLQYYVATQNSIAELFYQRRSFHPPLSFIINHLFLLLGESDFYLRLPSALFGIASLPLMYVLGRELTSKEAAVFSVFALALSPFHIWYSQEGRMYSQLVFLSLLSSVLLLEALRRGKAGWWVCYGLAGAAGMYTHVFMSLALTAHFLWIALYHRRLLVSIIASGFAMAVIFLPWMLFLPWVIGFAENVTEKGLTMGLASGGRAGFSWAVLPYTFFVYSAGFSLGPSVTELHADKTINFILTFLPSITIVTMVFMVLLGIGFFAIKKRFGIQTAMFCFLGLAVALGGTAVYSMTPRATFNVRYTVIAYPFFCLLLGTALAYLTSVGKVLGTGVVLVFLGISSISLYNHFFNSRYAKEDIRSAVAYWRQTAATGPLFALGSTYPTYRYAGASDQSRVFFIGGKNIVPWIEQVLLAQNTSSAYVVLARDWDRGREAAIRNVLDGTLERSFPGVKVFRISRPKTVRISGASVNARNIP